MGRPGEQELERTGRGRNDFTANDEPLAEQNTSCGNRKHTWWHSGFRQERLDGVQQVQVQSRIEVGNSLE